ncbi:MAG: hypothetical protein Q6365_009315 [Candidatus Sigynarchaeota archaeon]
MPVLHFPRELDKVVQEENDKCRPQDPREFLRGIEVDKEDDEKDNDQPGKNACKHESPSIVYARLFYEIRAEKRAKDKRRVSNIQEDSPHASKFPDKKRSGDSIAGKIVAKDKKQPHQ